MSGGAQKETRLVGRTAGQKQEGGPVGSGSGSWECVCVWEGPREVAAEAGDDNGVYMSQRRSDRASDVRLCVVSVCGLLYNMVGGAGS